MLAPSNTTSFYEMFSLHSFPSVQGVVRVEHNIIEMRNCMHAACSNLSHNPHTCNTHTRERASLFFRFFPLLFIHDRQSLTRSSCYASASHSPSSVASLHLLDTRLSRLRRLTTIHEAALPYSVQIIRRSILLHNT